MKLIRAEFCNFRLLRDLTIDFSGEEEKNLTVIRAENETGKTTILTALQWALYGDSALPNKGKEFRLHPLDWNLENSARVPVAVTVDFEIPRFHRNVENRRQYRIVRSAFEELEGVAWKRAASSVQLYRLSETGAEPIDSPDAFINDELPPELREVFFTDGDRALSFVDADVSQTTKRDRVQQAIRSLLGLGVLEDSIKHVKKSASEVNKKARDVGGGDELQTVTFRITQIEEDIDNFEAKHSDAKNQFAAFDERLNSIDKEIAEALKKGDKEALNRDLARVRGEIRQLNDQIAGATKDHSALFRGKSLACDLLKPLFKEASLKLDLLHDQGKIPNTTIPVLEDRLAAKICICGETLDENDPQGKTRRVFIENSIEASRKADDNRKTVTELYYASKELLSSAATTDSLWIPEYTRVVESRDGLDILRIDAGKKLKAIELKIDSLPDTDIQGLRETRRHYLAQRDRFLREMSTLETQISGLKRDLGDLRIRREQLLRDQKKGIRILADLEVSQDILSVLERAYAHITTAELSKVGNLMNEIFIEMIGADPQQGSIIRETEISKDFDIVVYGPNNKVLNTGTDLNGASRRALTISFILALTRISEVEAPNVIDTPLGMMSGSVKRSVLKKAISESSQLILFLTRSEIAGCEDILDEKAGVITTLTNPAHYPKILINDPGVKERKVIRCACTHRDECPLCARRLDADILLEEEVAANV
jgi:DNA sulfur modification protein DndD